jgi:hypothetical protein
MFSFFRTAQLATTKEFARTFFEKQTFVIENAPRKVKLDRTVRAIWALLVTFFWAWSMMGYTSFSRQPKKGLDDFIPGIVVFLVAAAGLFFALVYGWRNRNVLRNGIFTVGTVVVQKNVSVGRGRSKSVITYRFSVGSGKPMLGKGTDHTETYYENSHLLVCFDPNDIARNLALCCTYWRVRTQGGELIDP